MRKLPLVAILVVALCAAPRAALSKTTGTISSAHWSYAVLAQLSECAELDGCLSNIGYFDFARTNFHLSRQEAAHLVLDILHRAEIYKSEPMTTDKTSRWFDRSPYFLRSREARDAMQALIDEYRDELAQIEIKKGQCLDPAMLEHVLVSDAPLPMGPQNDEFRDIPKTHWAYEALSLIYATPTYETFHPLYGRGIMFGTFELTRYEFAVAIDRIQQKRAQLQRESKPSGFQAFDNIKTLELKDAFAALQWEFAPEIARLGRTD